MPSSSERINTFEGELPDQSDDDHSLQPETGIVPERVDLYARIIDLPSADDMPPDEDTVTAEITGEYRITANERSITLKGNQLFVLNALLVLGPGFHTMREIMELGLQQPNRSLAIKSTQIAGAMRAVENKLFLITQQNAIIRADGAVGLNPGIFFVDRRGTDNEPSQNAKDAQEKRDEAVRQREATIRDIHKLFKTDHRIHHHTRDYRIKGLGEEPLPTDASELTVHFQGSDQYRLLSAYDERVLFGWIDAGLDAHWLGTMLRSFTDPELREAFVKLAAAYDVLVYANTRLVTNIAKPYSDQFHIPLTDLTQEGTIGLMTAVGRFNIKTGNKFSTFATWWIRQSISRYVANTLRIIRAPVHIHEEWRRMIKRRRDLSAELGREASDNEVAAALSVTPERIRFLDVAGAPEIDTLNRRRRQRRSANDDANEIEVGDTIENTNDPLVAILKDVDLSDEATSLFFGTEMDDRVRIVLALRYGLRFPLLMQLKVELRGKQHPWTFDRIVNELALDGSMTLQQIADLLPITRERVRQLEERGLRAIRRRWGIPEPANKSTKKKSA